MHQNSRVNIREVSGIATPGRADARERSSTAADVLVSQAERQPVLLESELWASASLRLGLAQFKIVLALPTAAAFCPVRKFVSAFLPIGRTTDFRGGLLLFVQ
jgi:hypothetical protein